MRYLIPADFSGWIKLYYEEEGEPELPEVDGVRVIRVDSTGIVRTSSKRLIGRANDEAYFYDGEGLEPFNLSERKGAQVAGVGGKRSAFFVGTEEEFKRAGTPWLPEDFDE